MQSNQITPKKRRKPAKDTPPLYEDDFVAQIVSECGGVLVRVKLSVATGLNGGCGAPTHVVGTNGGTMTCGSMLTQFSKRAPYYCPRCEESRRKASEQPNYRLP